MVVPSTVGVLPLGVKAPVAALFCGVSGGGGGGVMFEPVASGGKVNDAPQPVSKTQATTAPAKAGSLFRQSTLAVCTSR